MFGSSDPLSIWRYVSNLLSLGLVLWIGTGLSAVFTFSKNLVHLAHSMTSTKNVLADGTANMKLKLQQMELVKNVAKYVSLYLLAVMSTVVMLTVVGINACILRNLLLYRFFTTCKYDR